MPKTRCRDVCFRFFSFYLYYLTNNSIINIDLDSSIWSHWQFLNTNIRTFLNSPTSLSLHSTVQWERGPFFVVDRGWCLEIAASVKRQFEVIRLVLVGGTLLSTICDTVIQGKEPCWSEKSTNICAKLSLNCLSLKGQGGVLREFGC